MFKYYVRTKPMILICMLSTSFLKQFDSSNTTCKKNNFAFCQSICFALRLGHCAFNIVQRCKLLYFHSFKTTKPSSSRKFFVCTMVACKTCRSVFNYFDFQAHFPIIWEFVFLSLRLHIQTPGGPNEPVYKQCQLLMTQYHQVPTGITL